MGKNYYYLIAGLPDVSMDDTKIVTLDASGRVLHIQDSSFLEEGQGYSKEKVQRFFKCWTPSAVN